jgi:hypothetical protein
MLIARKFPQFKPFSHKVFRNLKLSVNSGIGSGILKPIPPSISRLAYSSGIKR